MINYTMYELIYFFIFYSFIAWIMESTFKSLLYKKIINSGFLHGPFIPIYGIGAVFAVMFFNRFSDNIILLFGLGFVFMSLIEYIVGYVMEKIFNTSWWDYTGNFMNLGGKICLENSIYWGALIVLLIKKIHPFLEMLLSKLPVNYGKIGITVFIIYFVFDYMLSIAEVLNLQEKVGMFIKIKDNYILATTSAKVTELKEYIFRRSRRLLKVYPRLTYLKINKKLKDIVKELKK